MSDEKWAYTVPQVAERLQMSRSVTWRRVLSGEIPSIKIGRNRRVTAEAVEKLLKGGNTKGR